MPLAHQMRRRTEWNQQRESVQNVWFLNVSAFWLQFPWATKKSETIVSGRTEKRQARPLLECREFHENSRRFDWQMQKRAAVFDFRNLQCSNEDDFDTSFYLGWVTFGDVQTSKRWVEVARWSIPSLVRRDEQSMVQFLPPSLTLTPLTKRMSHCNSRVVTEHRRTSKLTCQQWIRSIRLSVSMSINPRLWNVSKWVIHSSIERESEFW